MSDEEERGTDAGKRTSWGGFAYLGDTAGRLKNFGVHRLDGIDVTCGRSSCAQAMIFPLILREQPEAIPFRRDAVQRDLVRRFLALT
jgi:hypothetical protein